MDFATAQAVSANVLLDLSSSSSKSSGRVHVPVLAVTAQAILTVEAERPFLAAAALQKASEGACASMRVWQHHEQYCQDGRRDGLDQGWGGRVLCQAEELGETALPWLQQQVPQGCAYHQLLPQPRH